MYQGSLGDSAGGPAGVYRPQLGMAPPPAAAPAAAAAPVGADPNLWYDPSKLQAAIAAQGAGNDGRTILNGSNLASIVNPNYNPNIKFDAGVAAHEGFRGSPGQDDWGMIDATPDQLEVNGQLYNTTKNADGTYAYTNRFDNPTGNGQKDQANISYTYDPKTGKSTPTGDALSTYNPSSWIDYGRLTAELAAVVGSAGAAGAYLGGGAGLGSTAAGTGGASAGSSAVTNQALLESSLNTAGYGASSAGQGLGAYASGAGYTGLGGEVAANTGATNPALIESASGTPGYGASSAGAGGGAGSLAGSGIGSQLKDAYDAYKTYAGAQGKGGQQNALLGLTGYGGGMSAGDKFRQQLTAQALTDQANRTTPAGMPGWIPGS